MSKSPLCRCLVFFVFLLGSAIAASAGDFTFFVAGAKPGSLSVSGIQQSLDSSPVIGGRFSYNFVPLFGMEHTLAFSPDYLFPKPANGATDAKGFVYSANLIINIPAGKIVPYATAGIGLLHQYGSSNLPVGTKFAFNYGGGVKLPKLAGPLGLRFDARGYTATNVFSSSLNILEVSAGILISF
jgi:hypothetical protein